MYVELPQLLLLALACIGLGVGLGVAFVPSLDTNLNKPGIQLGRRSIGLLSKRLAAINVVTLFLAVVIVGAIVALIDQLPFLNWNAGRELRTNPINFIVYGGLLLIVVYYLVNKRLVRKTVEESQGEKDVEIRTPVVPSQEPPQPPKPRQTQSARRDPNTGQFVPKNNGTAKRQPPRNPPPVQAQVPLTPDTDPDARYKPPAKGRTEPEVVVKANEVVVENGSDEPNDGEFATV